MVVFLKELLKLRQYISVSDGYCTYFDVFFPRDKVEVKYIFKLIKIFINSYMTLRSKESR